MLVSLFNDGVGPVVRGFPVLLQLPVTAPLSGRRILTLNLVIRVNQIEVSRTRNEGFDEYDHDTPENIQALRAAFAAGWPGAPMTWALNCRALPEDDHALIQARLPGLGA